MLISSYYIKKPILDMFKNTQFLRGLRPDAETPFIIFDKDTPDVRITDNFRLHEFMTKDFKKTWTKLNLDLIFEVCRIREDLGHPIWINSTYRSSSYNKAIGGTRNSYHIKGMAIDLSCNPEFKHELLRLILNSDIISGVGVYRGFFHVDVGRKRLFVG